MKLVKNEKGLIFGAFLLAMLVASPMVGVLSKFLGIDISVFLLFH